MADGRHFEKSVISILRQELSDFDQFWYTDTNFHSEDANLTKNRFFFKLKMADGRHIENCFLAISRHHILADLCKFRCEDERSHADIGHVIETAIFANSRWRTAAILKIALSPYLSCELSAFDQIWYTDTNFHSEHANLTKENRNFSNSRWRTDAILKIVFWLYLGAILADLCKFRNGDEESHADIGHLTKMAVFANSRWRTAAILKIALSPYLSQELSDFDRIWYADANFHS